MADISKINLPNDNNNPYDIADTTARSGLADKMDKTNPTGTGSFSLNRKAGTSIGTNSFAEGYNITASGNYSHAEGSGTTVSGNYSHAEGYKTTASSSFSHVEGSGTTASSDYSHAEGQRTTASGGHSHAEGGDTTASGNFSHAEGYITTASGNFSHAEGQGTTASGNYSHAEGNYTTANHKSQHVFGEYNVLDDSTVSSIYRGNYVEIVGNGTANNSRSNARTLDWSGNEILSGTIEATGFGTTLDKEVDRGGVQLTQAEYDALVNAGTVDANTTYFITDANNTTASYAAGVTYDNTTSGLNATDVQAAIDEFYEKTRYKIGDEVLISGVIMTGFITSSSTSLRFYIPLNKPFDQVGVRNINLANITASIRMVDGTYILNLAKLSTLSNSIRVYSNGSGLYVQADVNISSTYNNTPCAVQIIENTNNIITLA